jgi:hypothetical protein
MKTFDEQLTEMLRELTDAFLVNRPELPQAGPVSPAPRRAHSRLLATAATVLVIGMLAGLWALGNRSDRPTVDSTVPPTVVTSAPVPSTTITPTTSAPTTTPSADEIDALAGWVTPPPVQTPDVADLPKLLPAEPLGASSYRREFTTPDVPETSVRSQIWYSTERSEFLFVTTRLDAPPQPSAADPLGPWDHAEFAGAADGFFFFEVRDPTGSVTFKSRTLGEDELREIASALQVRPAGDGWELPRGDWTDSLNAWVGGVAAAFVIYSDDAGFPIAELGFRTGTPGLFEPRWPGLPITRTTFGERTVWAQENDGLVSVVWAAGGDVVASFGYRGSLDEALGIVATISEVDDATWQTVPLNTDPGDGCEGVIC